MRGTPGGEWHGGAAFGALPGPGIEGELETWRQAVEARLGVDLCGWSKDQVNGGYPPSAWRVVVSSNARPAIDHGGREINCDRG